MESSATFGRKKVGRESGEVVTVRASTRGLLPSIKGEEERRVAVIWRARKFLSINYD